MKYKKSELDWIYFFKSELVKPKSNFAVNLMQHFNMNKIAWKKLSME